MTNSPRTPLDALNTELDRLKATCNETVATLCLEQVELRAEVEHWKGQVTDQGKAMRALAERSDALNTENNLHRSLAEERARKLQDLSRRWNEAAEDTKRVLNGVVDTLRALAENSGDPKVAADAERADEQLCDLLDRWVGWCSPQNSFAPPEIVA